MRILILGGTGLISTSITRELLQRGDDVTHYNRGLSEARYGGGDVKRIVGDRTQHADFERQIKGTGHWDCVIDMIGYRPADAESDVRAFAGQTRHLIFCSTVDVYTKPATRLPYREDEPQSGIGSYAINKVACESILMQAHRRGDISVTIIRPAMTYGQGGGIHSSFGGDVMVDRLRKGKEVIVHGDGMSLWVTCHADDVGHAFVTAAGKERTFGRAYHVTGEEWMTWDQYHQIVAQAIGAPPPRIVHIPSEILAKIAPRHAGLLMGNFRFNNIFDNSAAKADLDFRYRIPWLEGVKLTQAWMDARGKGGKDDQDPFYDRVLEAWKSLGENMANCLAGQES
jgi:nucleoside-diphosphate-sugar epimerase